MAVPDIHWISTAGGPFIALPDSLLEAWHGYSNADADPLDTSHDYGRACAAEGYVSSLSVGESQALVFGENARGGVWLRSSHPVLFEWIYADSEAAVAAAMNQLPHDLPVEQSLVFDVDSDHLNVFDSAFSGLEFELQGSCRFPIQPSRYVIASSVFKPNNQTGLIVHRFVPV